MDFNCYFIVYIYIYIHIYLYISIMNFSCLGNMLAIPGCDMRKENSIFCSWTRTTCYYDLGLSRLGFKHPTFRLRGQRSNPLRSRRVFDRWQLICESFAFIREGLAFIYESIALLCVNSRNLRVNLRKFRVNSRKLRVITRKIFFFLYESELNSTKAYWAHFRREKNSIFRE